MEKQKEKILLVLLPYWIPQMPPLGLSCIKSYLVKEGYDADMINLNTDMEIVDDYHKYIQELEKILPEDQKSNFIVVSKDFWQHHGMIYQHNQAHTKAINSLVKELFENYFFYSPSEQQIGSLTEIVKSFYKNLEVKMIEILTEVNPDILGISVYIHTFASSMFCFKLAKRMLPGIKTVMGGGIFHTSLCFESENYFYFKDSTNDFIDKIIIGEGELLFKELLEKGFDNTNRILNRNDLKNSFMDLNKSPELDFSGFDLNNYLSIGAYASRSCPFRCKFCSSTVLWGKYRKKTAKGFVEELRKLYLKHNRQLFIFSDLLINPLAKEVAAQIIEKDLPIYWDSHLRVDEKLRDLNETLFLRKGGYYRAEIGCESGSQRVLDLMDKRITVEQTKDVLYALSYAGIKTTTYWVIGYPDETEEDFDQTLQFLEQNKDNIYDVVCNGFGYFPAGLVNSEQWYEKAVPLYSEELRKNIFIQEWKVEIYPQREIIFDRVNRFRKHINNIGIPQINSFQDQYQADIRWKGLHKNAVPAIHDLQGSSIVKEERQFELPNYVDEINLDIQDWNLY